MLPGVGSGLIARRATTNTAEVSIRLQTSDGLEPPLPVRWGEGFTGIEWFLAIIEWDAQPGESIELAALYEPIGESPRFFYQHLRAASAAEWGWYVDIIGAAGLPPDRKNWYGAIINPAKIPLCVAHDGQKSSAFPKFEDNWVFNTWLQLQNANDHNGYMLVDTQLSSGTSVNDTHPRHEGRDGTNACDKNDGTGVGAYRTLAASIVPGSQNTRFQVSYGATSITAAGWPSAGQEPWSDVYMWDAEGRTPEKGEIIGYRDGGDGFLRAGGAKLGAEAVLALSRPK